MLNKFLASAAIVPVLCWSNLCLADQDADPTFNGIMRYEMCRMATVTSCEGNYCEPALVNNFSNIVLAFDLEDKLYRDGNYRAKPMQIVETSKAEVGKPLWTKLTFKNDKGQDINTTLLANPQRNGGNYSVMTSISFQQADGQGPHIIMTGSCNDPGYFDKTQ